MIRLGFDLWMHCNLGNDDMSKSALILVACLGTSLANYSRKRRALTLSGHFDVVDVTGYSWFMIFERGLKWGADPTVLSQQRLTSFLAVPRIIQHVGPDLVTFQLALVELNWLGAIAGFLSDPKLEVDDLIIEVWTRVIYRGIFRVREGASNMVESNIIPATVQWLVNMPTTSRPEVTAVNFDQDPRESLRCGLRIGCIASFGY